MFVDPGGCKPLLQWLVQQEMIDPETSIAAKGIAEIIPERIDLFIGVKMPQGVCPSLRHELFKCSACLGTKERIIYPALGFVDIQFGRHDVVVACEHDGMF